MRAQPLILLMPLVGCSGEPSDTTNTTDTSSTAESTGLTAGEAAAWGPFEASTGYRVVPGPGVELGLQVWWPTTDTGLPPAQYDTLLLGRAGTGGTSACDEPRPVVVFSHGNSGTRYQSVFLGDHLASHGFLTAAPNHKGNTQFDMSVPRPEVAIRRPADVAASYDALVAASADPEDPLFGCVDESAGYAVIGHSFGGFTALATAGAPLDLAGLEALCVDGDEDFLCGVPEAWEAQYPGSDSGDLSDAHVWAAVALAPVGAQSLGAGLGEIEVPTMVIGAKEDLLTPWETEVTPIFEALTVEPRSLVGLDNAGHYHFTEFCELFPGCGEGTMSQEEAHEITNGAVVSWLWPLR